MQIRILLHNRIKSLARTHILKRAVSYDDRRDLTEKHRIYHDALGGNGNLDSIMADLMRVPLK